ncbi:MAG: hypothetical protein K0S27_1349 [Gammaproteobacteria bacterium]|jgi:hypothetical protein|nr:hypothetical protein [Gammaproteobacteria bacterium]
MTLKILKAILLAVFGPILIFQTATFANNKIVYGFHCTTHAGTENCDGWKIFIFSKEIGGNHRVVNWVPAPLPVVENMLYPDPPPEATAVSCNHLRGWCFFTYLTSLILTDPRGESKTFPYAPATARDSYSYIGHPNEPHTGGASLNGPDSGDIIIERSWW